MDSIFPKCPICRKEVLLPFSVSQEEAAKAFAHWICTNCGFYIGTGGSRGNEVDKDLQAGFVNKIVKKVEKLRREHLKQTPS